MHKKFEINRTKIKGGCQSGRQVVTDNSKSDLPQDKLVFGLCLLTYLINVGAISIVTILVVKTSIIPFRLGEQIVKAFS